VSKYELLNIFKSAMDRDVSIVKHNDNDSIDRTLDTIYPEVCHEKKEMSIAVHEMIEYLKNSNVFSKSRYFG
jgi:hypothetical protein